MCLFAEFAYGESTYRITFWIFSTDPARRNEYSIRDNEFVNNSTADVYRNNAGSLKERRAILCTVFEATANFSISKKKKKNNPVKQTTPKTGILHEPTSQGRRSQRRNKKKKKKSSKRIFSKICKRYLASSKSRSGPARVTNLSRASFFSFFTRGPSLPEQKNVARVGEAVGVRCAKSTRVSKGKRKNTKDGRRVGIEREARAPGFRQLVASGYFRATRKWFPSAGGGEDSSRPRSGCWPSRGFSPIYSRAGLKRKDNNLREPRRKMVGPLESLGPRERLRELLEGFLFRFASFLQ